MDLGRRKESSRSGWLLSNHVDDIPSIEWKQKGKIPWKTERKIWKRQTTSLRIKNWGPADR